MESGELGVESRDEGCCKEKFRRLALGWCSVVAALNFCPLVPSRAPGCDNLITRTNYAHADRHPLSEHLLPARKKKGKEATQMNIHVIVRKDMPRHAKIDLLLDLYNTLTAVPCDADNHQGRRRSSLSRVCVISPHDPCFSVAREIVMN